MAAGTIRESKTILTAEDKTAGAFASMQRSIEATTSRLSGLAALAGGGMVGGFALMIKNANDAMAAMKDLGQEAGVTASALSRFEEPAKLAGMTLADISSAIQKMSKSMIEAKDPTSKAAQALGAFGLSMRDMAGLKPDEMFEKIAKASTLYGNSIEKNAALQELFGKSGSALQKVFAEIADKGQLMATVTDEQAEAADKLGDSIDKLGLRSEQWRRAVAAELTPSIQKMIDTFTELTDKKQETGTFFEFIGGLIRLTTLLVGGLTLTLKDLGDQIGALAAKAQNISIIRGPTGIPLGFNVDETKNAAIDEDRMKRFRDYEAALKRLHESMKSGKATPEELDNFSPERQGKLAVAFDTTTKAVKDNKDAIKEAEKALRDYVNAAMAALAADEQTAKEIAELDKRRGDAILNTEKVIAQIEFETTLIGLNNDEREKAIALRALETSGVGKQTKDFENLKERLVAALDQQKAVRDEFENMRQTTAMWDEMGERAGNFFADLAMNGKSAFDHLRQSLKSFVAEILALFAKKWVLQMVAGVTGSTAAGSAAAGVFNNGSMAGSISNALGIGGAGGIFGASAAYAAAVPGLTSFGAGSQAAMLAAQTGEFGAAGLASTAAAGGSGIMGAVGTALPWVAGILAAYALIKKFGDKGENPKAQLGFGAGAQAYVTNGVFGAEGFRSIQTNDDFNQGLRAYMASFKGMDEALAKMLTDSQKQRISAALGSASQYEFAFPKGDGTAGEQLSMAYLKSKYGTVFQELDKTFADFVRNFTGSAEDLQKAIAEESAVLGLLADTSADILGKIPGLTIDGLRGMQQAGEDLATTFQRVVGDFLSAQAALNSAIASRNPQFARDLVLSQRNQIGGQFAASLGLNYANEVGRMALDPSSFGGLNTLQMGMLAQFLGLQTQLEQLDNQLANSTVPAIHTFTNTVINSASAMGGAISGLAAYLRGSLLSDLSPLNPQARYNEARKQYSANLTLAQGGNIDAISNFGSLRDQFLSASRAVNASSGQYNTDFFSTYNAGAALTGGQVRPYTAADGNANAAAIVAAVSATASGQQVTNTILVDYLNELANGRTTQNSDKVVELLGQLNDRVRINGGALTSGNQALA